MLCNAPLVLRYSRASAVHAGFHPQHLWRHPFQAAGRKYTVSLLCCSVPDLVCQRPCRLNALQRPLAGCETSLLCARSVTSQHLSGSSAVGNSGIVLPCGHLLPLHEKEHCMRSVNGTRTRISKCGKAATVGRPQRHLQGTGILSPACLNTGNECDPVSVVAANARKRKTKCAAQVARSMETRH